MPPTLAPDMARKSLGVLLERARQENNFSPDEARDLLASCEFASFFLERLWQLAQEFLDRGMEARQLTFLLKELVDVIELGITAFAEAAARVKVAGLTPEDEAEGLSMLERAGRRAAEMRDEGSALVGWLETPMAPIDPVSLPGGRGSPQAEGYVSLEDLAARLLGKDA